MKKDIRNLVKKHFKAQSNNGAIPVSRKIFDEEELGNLIEASLEGWWTEGKWAALFEDKLKEFLGVKFVHAVNSGSSANLLAFSALCSPSLGERQLKPGDEVITLAAGFPTTVNPIIQNSCIPVFVDIDLATYDIDVLEMEKALSKKTKAVMIAHTLGNPFNIKSVKKFCRENNLWLIEDNCDALGSEYAGKKTGTFGDIATLSFYPAHHITTAEGGAVITNNAKLSKILVSIRDWGRHCWCKTGTDNTCKNRFSWQLGQLPTGYDHKYIYGELGYNLKLSDLHAAIGVAQMDKLDNFIKKRRENFNYLSQKFASLDNYFALPKATKNADPSWFGYLLRITDDSIDREDLLRFLDSKKVGTRLLFAGNLIKQPYIAGNKGIKYRKVGNLKNTDIVMNRVFWIGLWPGLSKEELDYAVKMISDFIREKNGKS
ncbi:MAG: lipopolysaccharide biosynthesis protein RfbH [Patescibacteria group bacterium]